MTWQDQLEEYAELWYIARHMRNKFSKLNPEGTLEVTMDKVLSDISTTMKHMAYKKWCIDNKFRQESIYTKTKLSVEIEK